MKAFANLLRDELRDTDIVGQGDGNHLMVMIPYADAVSAPKVRERLEQILEEYGLAEGGIRMGIDEICFPTHVTNIGDLLRMSGSNGIQDGPERKNTGERF